MSQIIILRQFIQKHNRLIYNLKRHCRQQSGGSKVTVKKTPINNSRIIPDASPLREKIKEDTKTVSYTAIIVAGFCVTALMFWTIFRELFSNSSPNNVYSNALKLVKEDYRVQDAIGAPIKGYGEESRRGRRQHVAHTNYNRNGIPHMRMQFYIQGFRNKATVHLEARENSTGKMEYRYLYVQLNHYPHTVIILEDNRANDNTPPTMNQLNLSSANISSLYDGKK